MDLMCLMGFPGVIIGGTVGFFTWEAQRAARAFLFAELVWLLALALVAVLPAHGQSQGWVNPTRTGRIWDDTAGGPDVLLDVTGRPFVLTGLPPLHRAEQYGFYVQGIQQITGQGVYNPEGDYRPRKQSGWTTTEGLALFFNFIQTDRATATLDKLEAFTLCLGPVEEIHGGHEAVFDDIRLGRIASVAEIAA